MAGFDLRLQKYDAARQEAFHAALLENLLARPGGRSAALASVVPLSGIVVGQTITVGDQSHDVSTNSVSPDYFATIGIPLVAGRAFTAQDALGSPAVAIVNATTARQLWSDGNALGQFVRFGEASDAVQIVGVIRDAAYDEPGGQPPAFMYLPLAQRAVMPQACVLVRSDPIRPLPPA